MLGGRRIINNAITVIRKGDITRSYDYDNKHSLVFLEN
jgi:hypothetical protein